jgi:site-specific DNA-methyltransferase (cytosine-N4-specific)
MDVNDPMNLSVSPYYQKEYGAACLGDGLELIQHLPAKSVNLIVTSPPFALTRKKEYGNKSADEYVDWFLGFSSQFKRVLTDDGSLVIDLGGAYLPGYPVRAIYQFELLVRLCKEQGFFWRRNSTTIILLACLLLPSG